MPARRQRASGNGARPCASRRAATVALVLALVQPTFVAASDAPDVAADPHGVDPALLSYTYTVGSFTPEYVPPAPGSYALPVIKAVHDHPLLDVEGRPTSLFALTGGRVAVVAFVYTTCAEATGCPLSQAVLHRIDRALAADAALARQVRLITVSFDPERDTPARMKTVRGYYEAQTDWRFVTTNGEAQLQPLLTDFGQPVNKLRFPDGRWSGLYRHVLKVFLLDADNRVRNIYSVGFLNPELVLNDVRTLLMEGRSAAR